MSHASEEESNRLRALLRLCLDGYHSSVERVHQLERENHRMMLMLLDAAEWAAEEGREEPR